MLSRGFRRMLTTLAASPSSVFGAPRPRFFASVAALQSAIARGDSHGVLEAYRQLGAADISEELLEGVRLASEAVARNTSFVSRHYRVEKGELKEYLTRKGVEFKENGDELNLKTCPCCHPTKGKIDNMWKLYISSTTGFFFCHRCGSKGSLFDLKRHFGDIELNPAEPVDRGIASVANMGDSSGQGNSSIMIAKSGASGAVRRVLRNGEETNKKYKELMFKSDPETGAPSSGLEYVTRERGLSREIVEKFNVGTDTFRFQTEPGVWQDIECVTFPWYNDAGRLVRFKIRGIENKRNMRLDPAGGEWGFFGWNTVPKEATEIIVTEGEFDAMAAHQATGLPAVSLPNGARSLPIELLPMLERFRKIYLWMDDDIPGQEGATTFANKLGVGRCYIVHTRNGSATGPKDANDALREGLDLSEMIAKAKPKEHEQILNFSSLHDEVYREIANPSQVAGVPSRTLPGYTKIIKGLRRGELTIFTGGTGVGKTSLLSQLSLDYCVQGVPTLWGSFEIPNPRLAKKMLCQFAARDPAQLLENFDYWTERFKALPLHFLRFHGSTHVDQVLDAMDYAVYVHDTQHVVLDNLQFMTSGQGKGFERLENQDRAIEKFRKFATMKNVHISLVIHPRKADHSTENDTVLTLHSIFGSGKATQEADNVVIMQSSEREGPIGGGNQAIRYIDVRKNRFDGDLGKVYYWYEKSTGRFHEREKPM